MQRKGRKIHLITCASEKLIVVGETEEVLINRIQNTKDLGGSYERGL